MNDKSISRILINGDVYKLKDDTDKNIFSIELTNINYDSISEDFSIKLQSDIELYSINPSTAINLSINPENIKNPAKFILAIDFTDNVYPFSFNSDTPFRWKDGKLPDISLRGIHTINVMYMPIGENKYVFSGEYGNFLKLPVNIDTTGVITVIDERIEEKYSDEEFEYYSLTSSVSDFQLGEKISIKINERGYINNFFISCQNGEEISIVNKGTIDNILLSGSSPISFTMESGNIDIFETTATNIQSLNFYRGNINILDLNDTTITLGTFDNLPSSLTISYLKVNDCHLNAYGSLSISDLELINSTLKGIDSGEIDYLSCSNSDIHLTDYTINQIYLDGQNFSVYAYNLIVNDKIYIGEGSSIENFYLEWLRSVNSIECFSNCNLRMDGSGIINNIRFSHSLDELSIIESFSTEIKSVSCSDCFACLYLDNGAIVHYFNIGLTEEDKESIINYHNSDNRTIHIKNGSIIKITRNVQELIANNIIFIDADETSQVINLEE